ncbi:cytosolic phospholipase A2-like isoform X2 [Neocloeon triangulifer]|uniref:cytosolic phospholipase A2-like isoform X2 n=1 Tax=Neocloeon triangulifer TaxID=2078957 RepID=UPI00286F247C|nr:cytosolic phospholipase A2-like isoform X2 [Neocloeon triangulifer]
MEPCAMRHNFSKAYSAAGEAAKRNWQNQTMQMRVVSGMWSLDSFDPFQIFQVKHRECHILKVFVDKGVNISKGWLSDFVDKPDPYLILSVPGTPNGRKHTKTIDNTLNPVWKQEFEFYLDPEDVYQLEIVVMDANYTKDGEMGRHIVPLDDLDASAGRDSKDYVAVFKNGAKIFLKVELTENSKPDLRYSLALSDEEKQFLRMRRERIMVAMNNLMPENGPKSTREVPMIGFLGSGGGFRALVSMTGVCTALHDEGITDCLAYMASLSGSSWYLSYLYAQPDFPEKSPAYFRSKLRESISKDWKKLLLKKFFHYSRELINKKTYGQPVSFSDVFGHLIGETLLGPELKNSTLSSQRRCLEHGRAPMPLYTCINVKKNVSARAFQDWIEFSPFEVGMAKYGSFMKPQQFGSKFFLGKIIKEFPEYPLHFLQGVWGSAFCKLLKWHIRGEGTASGGDLTSTSDEELRDFKNEVEALTHSYNRTSAQLEFDIEGESDDEDFKNVMNIQEKPNIDKESASSSEELVTSSEDETDEKTKKLARRGALKQRAQNKNDKQEKPNSWRTRRQTVKKNKQEKAKNIWGRSIDALFCSDILDTRDGRAGMIFNPLRGLNLENTFDISPFHLATTPEDNFVGHYEATNLNAKKLYLVDSGLTFNIPFPLLLRPQRAVDLYLSFDFSTRESDLEMPFKQLIVSEKWAKLNHVPFPPVEQQTKKFVQEPIREFYIFENTEDFQCPTVVHFVILNKTFRDFKEPGVPRETKEEKYFADFNIFGPDTPYSILNFQYTHEQFDRLSELMEFNTRLGMNAIKKEIAKAIEKKRKLAEKPQPPIELSELPILRSRTKEKEFNEYMSLRMSLAHESFYDETGENSV